MRGQGKTSEFKLRRLSILAGVPLCFFLLSEVPESQALGNAESGKGQILAQKVMEEIVAKHSELDGMEISATPPNQKSCITIATTEAKGMGEKCDEDEFAAIKTNKPFVEKEMEGGKEVYDVTMPLHDSSGKVIGTTGLDFKSKPDQQESKIVGQAQQIVREFERRIPTEAMLFQHAD